MHASKTTRASGIFILIAMKSSYVYYVKIHHLKVVLYKNNNNVKVT